MSRPVIEGGRWGGLWQNIKRGFNRILWGSFRVVEGDTFLKKCLVWAECFHLRNREGEKI